MKGCSQKITVKLGDRKYLWDGNKWIDLKNYTIPPIAIVEKLNTTFQEELKDEVEAQNFFLN